MFETYPPADYPRFYPRPMEYYEKKLRRNKILNICSLLAVLTIVAARLSWLMSGKWDTLIVLSCFLIQIFPLIPLHISLYKDYKLMRENDSRTIRKAELKSRRLFEFLSPGLIGMAVFVYIAFAAFAIYIVQIEDEWYEAFYYIFMVTVIYLIFAVMIIRAVYDKKRDPYQADEDRKRQIKLIVRIFIYASMVVTLFISLSIVLSFADMRSLNPIVWSLYVQIMALIPFRTPSIDEYNFEVYKDDTPADIDGQESMMYED
ncbi:hypothetical protein ACFL6G_07470 [candidate division KSB1 bacterium]